jgi:KDO2-lipid IV(A) lauroyltransferase
MRDALAFLPARAVRAGLSRLPPETAVRLGARIGRIAARLGGRVTRTARINLALAFPERTHAERARLLADAYANLGRGVAELALLQGPHREALLDRARVEGAEHLHAAAAASPSGGVILLSAHFGAWDLGAVALARAGFRLSVVHRGFANPHLTAMIRDVRRRGGQEVEEIVMGGMAGLAVQRALRAGRVVVVLLDQNARRDEGVFVPFFSRLACTRKGPALIAMRGGFPVVPTFVCREDGSARSVVRVQPALALREDGADRDAALLDNVTRMTRCIEDAIRERPDHWLWPHRRWRTRPTTAAPGEAAPVYPARHARAAGG